MDSSLPSPCRPPAIEFGAHRATARRHYASSPSSGVLFRLMASVVRRADLERYLVLGLRDRVQAVIFSYESRLIAPADG